MGAGALCRRFRLIDETSVKGVVNILILVVTPCIIIDSFQRPFDPSMMRGLGLAVAVSFVAHAALVLIAHIFRRGDGRAALRQMFLNPGTIGIAAGLPLFLFSASLPQIVRTPVSLLAGLNTPLAMLVIGFYLAGADFRRVVRTPAAYLASAVRLVAFPLAMIALFG